MSFCPVCTKKVFSCEAVLVSSRSYHGRCCKCSYIGCCTRLSPGYFYVHQNQLFCKRHVLLAEKHPEMVTPIPEAAEETKVVATRSNTHKVIPEPEPPKPITFGKEFFIQREQERLQKLEKQKREQEEKLAEKKRQEQEKKEWFEKTWLGNVTTMETHTDILQIIFSMLGLYPALCCCACTCKRWHKLITMKDGAYELWYKKYLGPEKRIDWNWRDVIHHVKSNTTHLSKIMRWYSEPEVEWEISQDTIYWIAEGGFEKVLDHIFHVWLPIVKNKKRAMSNILGVDTWYPSCNVMYWAMKSRNTRMMDFLLQKGAVFPQYCASIDYQLIMNINTFNDQNFVGWILSKPMLAKHIFLEIACRGDINQIKVLEALGFPNDRLKERSFNLWELALGYEIYNHKILPETQLEELREWLFEKKQEKFIRNETIIKIVKKYDIPILQRLMEGGANLNISTLSRFLASCVNSQGILEQECPLDLFTFLVIEGGVKVSLLDFFEPGAACVQSTALPKLQILRKIGGYPLQTLEFVVAKAIISGCKLEIFKELVSFPEFSPSADMLKPFKVSPKVVEVFLQAGMDINQLVGGRNMLQWALGNGDKVLATFLIKQNIEVNPVTKEMPPLALAVMLDVVGMSALLIKAGADVEVSVKALGEVNVKLEQKLRDIVTKITKKKEK